MILRTLVQDWAGFSSDKVYRKARQGANGRKAIRSPGALVCQFDHVIFVFPFAFIREIAKIAGIAKIAEIENQTLISGKF